MLFQRIYYLNNEGNGFIQGYEFKQRQTYVLNKINRLVYFF